MAPFGVPRYADKVYKLIRLGTDGRFELDMDYFSFHGSTENTFNRKFVQLFGTPRGPRSRALRPPLFGQVYTSSQEEPEQLALSNRPAHQLEEGRASGRLRYWLAPPGLFLRAHIPISLWVNR